MVDHITEIPLPGRTLVSPLVAAASATNGTATAVTLPSFVAGPENRLVATAVTDLLDRGGALLALYGASGTGKTHLARGAVHHWQQRRGAQSAVYITASDFRQRFHAAIDTETVGEFRAELRERELLAIDELDRLPGDDYLAEELRYTVDAYEESGGTLLVTSTRPVGALQNVSPDVRSRLSAGLVLQLAEPGAAAREQIVRQLSAALGQPLSDEAARSLADGVRGPASVLFGAVFELCAERPKRGVSDVRRTESYLAQRAARQPTLRQIVAVVARYYSVPQKVLKSGSRKRSVVLARAMAVYLARELAGASYQQIGQTFGGRDHTTIMHSYRNILQSLETDPVTQEATDELRRLLATV